jgi:hypothetical protein
MQFLIDLFVLGIIFIAAVSIAQFGFMLAIAVIAALIAVPMELVKRITKH